MYLKLSTLFLSFDSDETGKTRFEIPGSSPSDEPTEEIPTGGERVLEQQQQFPANLGQDETSPVPSLPDAVENIPINRPLDGKSEIVPAQNVDSATNAPGSNENPGDLAVAGENPEDNVALQKSLDALNAGTEGNEIQNKIATTGEVNPDIPPNNSLVRGVSGGADSELPNRSITGETLPEIQGENGIAKSLQAMADESQNKQSMVDLPEVHGDVAHQSSEQEEASKEDKMFAKIKQTQEETIKKFGTLLPLGDIARPDLYLQDKNKTPQIRAGVEQAEHKETSMEGAEPHIERKQYDDDYSNSPSSELVQQSGATFKKDELPSTNTTVKSPNDSDSNANKTKAVSTSPDDENRSSKPNMDPSNVNTTSPLDNNIINNTVHAVADNKPHGLNIEVSKSKSVSFDNPNGVKLSTSTASLKKAHNNTIGTSIDHPTKRTQIPKNHKKAELVLARLRKTLKGILPHHHSNSHKKEELRTEKGDKKNAVVVNRPDVVYHPPPEIHHRPPIIVHRPPLVIQRPPIIYHQPPVVVHRPSVLYQQPPLIFHQPPPAVSQPVMHSHDHFVDVPQLQHVGSQVESHGSLFGTPQHSSYGGIQSLFNHQDTPFGGFDQGQEFIGNQQQIFNTGPSYLNGHGAGTLGAGAGRSVQLLNFQPEADEMQLGSRKSTIHDHHHKKHHHSRARRNLDSTAEEGESKNSISKKDKV